MEFQERRGYEMGVSLGGVAKNGQIGMRCSFGRLEWATKYGKVRWDDVPKTVR